jgi:hypothetical protein
VHDRSVAIDDDDRPGWHVAVAREFVEPQVVGADRLAVPVAEEREADSQLARPGCLREMAVTADAIDLGSERADLLDPVPLLGQLVRSATREGEVEKGENGDPLRENLGQR